MDMIKSIRLVPVFIVLLALALLSGCMPKEIPPPVVDKPVKVAVVLGAGAAKGFAHIGVLKVLEANRIPVNMVVGTSAGSFVGSLYAYGFTAFQLQKISFDIQKAELADYTIPDNGFIKGEKLEAYINRMLRNTPMDKLRIPFYAVATDIQSGKEVVFGSGNTGSAVRASCSIPGVFTPAVIGGRMYVDGGLVSPVAVEAALRQGADVVIAVDISGDGQGLKPTGTLATILQSVGIMYEKIAAHQLQKADVVIKPNVASIGTSDFTKRHEAVLEGERAATAALPAIKAAISRAKTGNKKL
ncbi:MAG: patatin-like phospholipase family protein [Deltaproteobacteria bacterium]|nr:patatin-like phospholipase family protein [Deltaproteobacteria bacterium]TLN05084.1 MAG: patatin-like phospholipase family protein [bacterium]